MCKGTNKQGKCQIKFWFFAWFLVPLHYCNYNDNAYKRRKNGSFRAYARCS